MSPNTYGLIGFGGVLFAMALIEVLSTILEAVRTFFSWLL